MQIVRYAVSYAPRPGAFADRAAAWLGWDANLGRNAVQTHIPGLPVPPVELTRGPRQQGFHGALRASFCPNDRVRMVEIDARLSTLAAASSKIVCDGLELKNFDGILALMPVGPTTVIDDLAADVVKATNDLRGDLSAADIASHRTDLLTPRQYGLLLRWGHPFVMEEFRFHMMLTDRLAPEIAAKVMRILSAYLEPTLPKPFVIEDICLFGEGEDQRFHLIHRYALTG